MHYNIIRDLISKMHVLVHFRELLKYTMKKRFANQSKILYTDSAVISCQLTSTQYLGNKVLEIIISE